MEYNKLPGTEIEVSKICLGTMTWGRQNNEQEGHEQMDYAFEQGVNFLTRLSCIPFHLGKRNKGKQNKLLGLGLKRLD